METDTNVLIALGHSDIELAMALKEKKAELELRHRNAIEARALRDKKAADVDACTTAIKDKDWAFIMADLDKKAAVIHEQMTDAFMAGDTEAAFSFRTKKIALEAQREAAAKELARKASGVAAMDSEGCGGIKATVAEKPKQRIEKKEEKDALKAVPPEPIVKKEPTAETKKASSSAKPVLPHSSKKAPPAPLLTPSKGQDALAPGVQSRPGAMFFKASGSVSAREAIAAEGAEAADEAVGVRTRRATGAQTHNRRYKTQKKAKKAGR